MNAGPDGQLAASLLGLLRDETGAPDLAYADPPRRIHGGNETRIFGFRLQNAPDPFDGPLILRLYPPHLPPEDTRLEGAMQNALAAQGFPAARVFMAGGPDVLGGAFLLMERLPGRPMLADLMLPDEAGVPRGSTARILVQVPGLLAAIPRRFVEVTRRLQAVDAGSFLRTLEASGLPAERLTVEWRLAELRRRIEDEELAELRPGLDWLLERRPPASERVLCHGDLQPLNIMLEDGKRLSGVVDWSQMLAAEPAFEVGWTRTTYLTLPLAAPLVPFARWIAARYYRLAARERALDPAAVRYYEALRCLHLLALHAESRKHGRPYAHAWNSPRGIANLISHVRSVSGREVRLPLS